MNKKLIIAVFISTFVLLLAACGDSEEQVDGSDSKESAGPTTITIGFWGTAEDLEIYNEATKSISEKYPDIKLEIKQYPSSEQFWNKLPGEIAAGVAPDVLKIANEGAFEYISKDLFTPLDEYIGSQNLDLSVFNQNSLDVWKVDDKTYGIPNVNMPAMFFVNKDMWEAKGLGEYPKTWDDVQTAAKKLSTDDVYGIGINLHPFHITNFVKSYGGGWGNGETINSEKNVQALEKIFEMYEQGIAVTPKTLGLGWDGEVFANEKAVMTTGGYWYKSFLSEANPDLNYEAFPIPEGTTKGSTMISDAYVVLNDSKHKELATKAAYYLTSKEVQEKFMEIGQNPSRTALSNKYFELNPEFSRLQGASEYSSDFGYPTNTKQFTDSLVQKLESKILSDGDQTAKEILDSLQEQFN